MKTIALPPCGGNTGVVPPWLQNPIGIYPPPPAAPLPVPPSNPGAAQ